MGRWVPMPDIEQLADLLDRFEACVRAEEAAAATGSVPGIVQADLALARQAIDAWCDTYRAEQWGTS